MELEGLPSPWDVILGLIVGPVGAFVAMGVIVYFLWKLFREEQKENRENFATVSLQSQAIEKLTSELAAWRAAIIEERRR